MFVGNRSCVGGYVIHGQEAPDEGKRDTRLTRV